MFKKLVIVFCIGFIVVAAGCTAKEKSDPNPPKEQQADSVMRDFNTLVQKDPGVEEVANFVNVNISKVSKEDASEMVDQFEKMQKKSLPQFEAMFNKEGLQEKLNHEYPAISANKDVQDTGLRELVAKTTNSGYKMETAEGFYFPIIDYGFYKGFSAHVTADMKEYIDIMTRESGKVPAKDAALMIGWEEVLERALHQERFLSTHKDSIRTSEVKQLYKKYAMFTFYGADNTPLFRHDSGTMDPKAKEIYFNALANAGSSELLKTLGGFLDIVTNNKDKLTKEAMDYRDSFVKTLG